MLCPAIHLVIGLVVFFLDVVQYAEILYRVDFAGDDQRHASHQRAVGGIARQQRRLGIFFIKILDDGERLGQNSSAVFQRGHERLRIDRLIGGGELLAAAAAQMDRRLLRVQAFQIESNAHTVRRRATEKSIKLHENSSNLE